MTVSEFVNKVGFKVNDNDVKKVNSTISDIKKTATKVLGTIGIGFSLVSMKNLIEEFGQVNNQINYATGGLEAGAEAQKKILEAANNCRGTYSEIASYATGLAQANSELFPIEDAATFVEYTTKLGKAAGYTDSVISYTNNTLSKVMAAGKMGTAELKNLSENAPAVLNTISNRLGVSKEQLEAMAKAGTLSAQQIKDAMLNSAGEIDDAFSNVNLKISDALKNIRNRWGLWLAETDEMIGLTKTIAKTMISGFNSVMNVMNKLRTGVVWLSEKVGGMENLIKLVAITAGTIFAALNASKIIGFLKTVGSFLGIGNAKLMAIVAVIVIIALVIEDLFNFVKGNNSLIGSMLEKAGLNADEFRNSLKGLWSQLKGIIPLFVEVGKQVGGALLSAFVKILPVIIDLVTTLLPVLVDFIVQISGFIADIISQLLPVLIDFLAQLVVAVLPVIAELIATIIPLVLQIIQTILPVVINLIQQILPLLLQIIEAILPVVIELINAILPLIADLITELLPIIIDLVSQILPLLIEIIEAILPVAIELIEAILPPLIEIIEAILPVVIDLVKTIIPPLIQIIEAILPVVIELIKAILPIITQIIQSVLPVIIQLINTLMPLLKTIIDAILPVIISLINSLLPILEPIFDIIGTLVDAFLPVIVSLLQLIGPILQPIAAILKPIGDLLGLIIGAISKVVGWVTSGLKWIIDLIFGTGGDDASANASKISGYAKGTESSDETFIAGEEGPELITGAKGKKVFTALETGNIFSALAMLSKTANAQPANITSSNSSSRTINQYNEFVNTFNGDKAIQKEASNAMNVSAEDVTALLARGLAYSG